MLFYIYLYIYMYMYIYVHVCVYTHMCVYKYVYIYVCTYMCVHIYKYIFILKTYTHRVGKSRFTVVSMVNTVFSLSYYLLIIVLFSIVTTVKLFLPHPVYPYKVLWLEGFLHIATLGTWLFLDK